MIDLQLHHSDLLELGLGATIDAIHDVQTGRPPDLQAVMHEYAKERQLAMARWQQTERLMAAFAAGTFDQADAAEFFANRGDAI